MKVDWSKFVKVEKYDKRAFGIWPTFSYIGLGLGIGLGKIDVWVGWPKHKENLHYPSCQH